ncbi:ATP-binding protein [Adlercreutzia sp. ZJ141]|uniref:ATP-binding protein n=1 Tax=Adlercreutzia sp. ZJ141 TaxID=2709406 RepID=UPI0013E9ED02|nr:ATP-binding protein [Adlercreutzia sp. ZJ141]
MTNSPDTPGPYTLEELDEMGVAHDEPPEFFCEHCGKALSARCYLLLGGTAWVPYGQCQCEGAITERRREEDRAHAQAVQRRIRELQKIGIEPRYQNAILCRDDVISYLATFGEHKGNGLFIQGISGSGKTSLCSAIVRDLHDAGHSVFLVSASEMLETIQETFDKPASTANEIARYAAYELLAIDDMGRESGSEWAVSTMYRILNKRYGCMRPTIIASEHKLSSLGVRMSRRGDPERVDAILSRIKQVCALVKLPDVDYRIARNGFPVR